MHPAIPVTLLVRPGQRPALYRPAMVRQIEDVAGGPAVWVDSHAGGGSIFPPKEVIFSTWGVLPMDAAFLAALPAPESVFYAAGSVRGFVTPDDPTHGGRVPALAAGRATATQCQRGQPGAHGLRRRERQHGREE